MPLSAWLSCLLILKYFVNRGTGNAELAGDIRCATPFTVECQHSVPVDGTPAAKPDALQLRFLPTFIGPFQNSTSLSLSDSGKYSDHHFAHISIGANPIVNKTNGNTLGIELWRVTQVWHR